MSMCRVSKFLMLVMFFLSACGEGSDKQKAGKAKAQASQQGETDPLRDGPYLFTRYACFTCHSIDGGVLYGPALNGLHMKEVKVIRQSREITIIADRKYLKKAILDPDYEKVSGYENRIMPVPQIPKEDLRIILDYLIELGEEK